MPRSAADDASVRRLKASKTVLKKGIHKIQFRMGK